jgi:glycosyltransferase involved in cell wall biosynthesis
MASLAISVIIPTYNRAALLGRAVRSALAAVGPEDEILVMDDASTDNTAQVAAQFGDRIRYVPVPHGGAGAARNHGLRLATRPLVAFLDSDDELLPDRFRLQRPFLERRPDVLFCFSDFLVRLEDGTETHNYVAEWRQDQRGWDDILGPGVAYSSIAELPPRRPDFRVHIGNLFLAEMESDHVATHTILVRREAAGPALRFAEDLPVSEDKECFARLAQAGPAAYFDCETAIQYGHAGPRLTDANVHVLASVRLTLLDRIWGQDAAFVARHGDRLEQARRAQRLKRAQWLIARGRTREAREDLREAGPCPLSFRMLAALPGPVTRAFLSVRRLVRGGR